MGIILRQVNLRELESIKYNDDVKKSFLCLHDYGYDFEKGKPGFTIDELADFIKLVEKHDLSFNCDNVEGYYLGYVTENSGIREQFFRQKWGVNIGRNRKVNKRN